VFPSYSIETAESYNLSEMFEGLLKENVSLAEMTTLGVGGRARFFCEATSADVIRAGVIWAKERGLPLFVLGGGSNVVISDSGFPGLVLSIRIRGIETRTEKDNVILTAGAGEEWDTLVAMCVLNNWAGVECLSGIPGSVGATPIQNVGAYGQETSETLASVEAFDRVTNDVVEIEASECRFGYRTSRFKTSDRDRFIITRVTYILISSGAPSIRYAELERYLADKKITEPTLAETRQAVIAIRRRKAMVIDPNDMDSRSVGSFFVNPVVSGEEFNRVSEVARRFLKEGESMPAFSASNGGVKLSAAWLIERAGFHRGYVRGNAGISSKHALALINRDGAEASEIIELAEEIKRGVSEVFGVTLVPEPVMMGFDQPSEGPILEGKGQEI
jgi:UDP-N-acetylmuramate dehydrogenase